MPADPRPDLPPMPVGWVVREEPPGLAAWFDGGRQWVKLARNGAMTCEVHTGGRWAEALAHLRALSTRDATVTARSQLHTGEGESDA